ncbi:MAG: winged helix-turn-helix transcriptional regulator [Candidatus Methanomethylophilus sp.]|nr:winged helix-turn-helix transcriptional regulator [Methanomethylophilus sp.]
MGKVYDEYWNTLLPTFMDRVSYVMKKSMTEAVKGYGITSAHVIYLIALKLQDGQTIVELSRFLDMDNTNTNRVMKVLKEKGYVTDDRASATSKKYHYYLTDMGNAIAEHAMEHFEVTINTPFGALSLEERLQLRNILLKIISSLDPDFQSYMESKYTNPFYTYLGFLPPEGSPEAKIAMSKRAGKK